MDKNLSRSKVVTSESTSTKRRKRNDKKTKEIEEIGSKKLRFCDSYIPKQNWSLPDSVIYYITKNPSTSEVYQKLIQSCKYFFHKNPIFVISKLELFAPDEGEEWETRINGKSRKLKNVFCKLWIADEINVDNDCFENVNVPNFLSSVILKIYRCDITKLNLSVQNLSYKEFIFLASNVEELCFGEGNILSLDVPIPSIKNDDGTVVALEKLVEALPKIKKFVADFSADGIITSNTVKELLKISHFANLNILKLTLYNECFDIDTFYDYIKKNKKTKFILRFFGANSVEYNNRLQKIVDEILHTKIHDFKIPYINFIGIEYTSKMDLWKLFKQS